MDLSTALDLYFAEKWDLSETTRTTYRYHLRHFANFIGNPEIEDITSADINRYLGHVVTKLGLSRRTASDHWICLSSVFSWAEETLALPHPIKGKVKRPKFQKPVIDVLTEDECRALIRHVGFTTYARSDGKVVTVRRKSAVRDRAILLALLDGGLRASELCNLTVADWEAKRGKISVKEGKGRHGGKDRNIYVGQACRAAIIRYLAGRGKTKPSDPLFASDTGRKLNRNNLRHLLNTIAKSAKIRQETGGIHPHLLRHSFAVNFLRNGGDIRTLQQILGHQDLETVSVYLNLAERDIEAAAEFSPADRMRL